jgi:hypothetical protein
MTPVGLQLAAHQSSAEYVLRLNIHPVEVLAPIPAHDHL